MAIFAISQTNCNMINDAPLGWARKDFRSCAIRRWKLMKIWKE